MEIIISTYPEKIKSSPSVETIVKDAIIKVGELYGLETAEVSVTLTDNVYIHELNMKYRNIDRPTDVLSFALNEGEEPDIVDGPSINMLGDIIVSVERATEQAAEYGHSIEREIAFLTVHGMLHLLGYDHMEEVDRAEMRKEEDYVMAKLGIGRES
ncbi:rRNA maturation RNase YbeY [Propionispira raffinosivorans]|uniref:rRNA maturation RNase YbeY n=1 Tax=Propionispira raffinosivorans TaxID=86959 RepID=UPI000362E5BF|nr:rRNA maturation RNase YbeY [Propionispira raffinosivorans]